LDTDIYIWSVAKPLKTISIKNAVMGGVNTVSWLEMMDGKGRIAGAGADPSVRLWEVTFHA
jgi:WD40 repeat protein